MFKIYVLEGNKVGLHCLSFVIMSFMETKFLSVITQRLLIYYWYYLYESIGLISVWKPVQY